MATKGAVPGKSAASKQPPVVVTDKKKKSKKRKGEKGKQRLQKSEKALTAMAMSILDEIGRCPISMEPMRRPVLPSSGQAYDEINIVRYCSSGNKRCPVSGGPLKVSKGGKVLHTVDFALRKLITTQAAHAKLTLPSTDKDALFREFRESCLPETAKAIVDDCYLGYISFSDLQQLLEEFSAGRTLEGRESKIITAFTALLAECFACRDTAMVNLAIEYLKGYETAWNDPRVLREALAVGQDPDCRGQVLVVMEDKVKRKMYGPKQLKTILNFETESVPVQQFQARVAELVLRHGGRELHPTDTELQMVPYINLALRVREDLDGCLEEELELCDIWVLALDALQFLNTSLDDACLDRLFWREKRMILRQIACTHDGLLLWHLRRHPTALASCIAVIANASSSSGFDDHDGMYSSEEDDYYSEDEDGMDDGSADLQMPYNNRTPRNAQPFPALSNLIHIAGRHVRRPA